MKNNHQALRTISVVSILFATHNALASNYSINGIPNSTGYQSSGATITGSFDINSLLANPVSQYSLLTGNLSFSFNGANSPYYTGSTTTFDGSTGGGSSASYSYYTQTNAYYDSLDSVSISFGSSNAGASDSANYYSNLTTDGTTTIQTGTHTYSYTYPVTYTYSCGFFQTCTGTSYQTGTGTAPDYAVTTQNTQYSGYAGEFSFLASLGVNDLTDLAQDGILNYAITVNGGNVALTGASLSFDAELTQTAAPVPLPAATWLMLSGLLGVFGVQRRRF